VNASGKPAIAIDLERVICRLEDLQPEGARAFTIGDGDWPLRGFLVRSAQGVHGYVNRCPHAGHPLNLLPGRFLSPDGSLILCASHGALFEKATGFCVAGPCAGRTLTPLALEVHSGLVMLAASVDVSALREAPAPEG
jgi:nitrite reductase/ring-hydroxylating ferredoxin subunit